VCALNTIAMLTVMHGWRGWIGSVLLLGLVGVLLISDPGRDGGGRPQPAGNGGAGESARAFVTRAIDGDTIEVRIGGRTDEVRYIGVDTPETVKPGTPVQCFGPPASDYNHSLVERRWVRLVFDRERRDVYGRLLAYVYLGRRFVNARLAALGYARTLTIPPNDSHARLFHRLARRAALAGRGLWGAC
jgi:micrococcal nuclease